MRVDGDLISGVGDDYERGEWYGNATVGYSVAANGTTSPRTGTLTIGGQPFTITQAGGTHAYTASPAAQSFTDSGGPARITLTTGRVRVECDDQRALGHDQRHRHREWQRHHRIHGGANPVATSRNGTIAVGGQVVTISQ